MIDVPTPFFDFVAVHSLPARSWTDSKKSANIRPAHRTLSRGWKMIKKHDDGPILLAFGEFHHLINLWGMPDKTGDTISA